MSAAAPCGLPLRPPPLRDAALRWGRCMGAAPGSASHAKRHASSPPVPSSRRTFGLPFPFSPPRRARAPPAAQCNPLPHPTTQQLPATPLPTHLPRWSNFLSFLDGAGLLTSKVQSRAAGAGAGATATLDELRTPGGGGGRVPAPAAEELATNEFFD